MSRTETKLSSLTFNLRNLFENDQIKKNIGHQVNWTTLQKALQIRTATGTNGFNFTKKFIKNPMLSYRTISRHVEQLQMLCGI